MTELIHPLSGADLRTLVGVALQAGPPKAAGLPALALAFGSALGRLPFTAVERAYVALAAPSEAEAVGDPIFLVGHWRSGTTHLYNILSRSPAFATVSPYCAGLPWEFLLLGRLIEPLLRRALPEKRWIDNVPVEPDSPQEDEVPLANMTDLSFYHAIYFPRRFERFFARGLFLEGCSEKEVEGWFRRAVHLYRKIALEQPGRRLLIKNPVYTARVALLARRWPEARFIHIHRNPYEVFLSTRRFYERLFAALALQDASAVEIDRVVVETYRRMMSAFHEESAALAPGRLVELGFEDMKRSPLEALERLYDSLALEGFERDRPAFERYLAGVEGYRQNRYDFAPEAIELVNRHWGEDLERYGYARL